MDTFNKIGHRRRRKHRTTTSSSAARNKGAAATFGFDVTHKDQAQSVFEQEQAASFEQKQPIISGFIYLDKNGFPEPDQCRNPFFRNPTPFPKPNLEQLELPESLPRNLQLAVQNSIVKVKLKRIEDRFEPLALAAGVTEAELQILRETKYDRSVFQDFLNNRWREAGDRVAFGKAKDVIASWICPNGKKRFVHRERTLSELYAWKCKAEEEINNLSLDEISNDPNPEVDWNFVSWQLSNTCEGDWSAERCESWYKYSFGPQIRHLSSWTREDLEKFRKIIASSQLMDFTEISKKMGHGFTPVVCFKAYKEDYERPSSPGLSSSLPHHYVTKTRRHVDENSYETSSDESSCDESFSDESFCDESLSDEMSSDESSSDTTTILTSSDESDIGDDILEYLSDSNPIVSSCEEKRLLASNLTRKGVHSFTSEWNEEFEFKKKTPFIDVEDAILLVAVQQFKQCHKIYKAFETCDTMSEGLGVDTTNMLPWREDECTEGRLNMLFRRPCVVPWSLEEDQRLLFLTWLHPNKWTKISTYFQKPHRSSSSLSARLILLKRNLEFCTLKEFHRFLYSYSYEVRNYIQRPYTSLKRALACLESLLESKRRGEDWVSKYIAIYAPLKHHDQIDMELSLLRAQIGNQRCEILNEEPGEPEEEPGEDYESKEHKTTNLELYDKPVTRISPPRSTYHEASAVTHSGFASIGPPGHTELIMYLWDTDTQYIIQACDFITNFLQKEKVSPHLTEVELLDHKWRCKRSGFNRDNSKCVAAAAYSRKIKFKSDYDLVEQQTALSPFEESTLSWYKWYSTSGVLKRTVKRNIPEKSELLLYPELQKLLHQKYAKPEPKPNPIEIKLEELKSEIKLEPEDVKDELDMNELWALVPVNSPTPAQDVPSHEDHCMDTAQGVPGTTTSPESETPAYDSGYVSPPVSFPTLKTLSGGKGKKVSRKSTLRREIAKARWAKRKSIAAEPELPSEEPGLTWADGVSLVLVKH